MNEYDVLGGLHNIIDEDIDNRIHRWIDAHNVNFYLLYPLAAIELGAIKGAPESMDNLFKRCIATFIFSKVKEKNKEIYLRKFNTPGFKKYLKSCEDELLAIYQNYRFSREINDINPFSKPRLVQKDDKRYILTTSLVTDIYREEDFYFHGVDDPENAQNERMQVFQLQTKFWNKIILGQKKIEELQKCVDKELYQECIDIVNKDLNKWDSRVRSTVFDNPAQLAKVIAFFYYQAMLKAVCTQIVIGYTNDFYDIGKECVMVLQKKKCIEDIYTLSGIPESKVTVIIEYFVNDGRMNLQEFPLFEIEDKIITIPSAIMVNDWQFTVVNGHYIKNILIKNREKTISTVTERHIEKTLQGIENIAVVKAKPYSYVDVKGEKQCSDIDYAIYDMTRNILLVIEAKWIDKHYKDEIDKRYGMILKTLNDIYTKQIEKHKEYLSIKENIDSLFREDKRYDSNMEMPEIVYLAVDKRNQLHIDERHMLSEFMLIYFLKKYIKSKQLDIRAMWNEIGNLQTKVEYISISDSYHEIPVGEDIVLVEKSDLYWE